MKVSTKKDSGLVTMGLTQDQAARGDPHHPQKVMLLSYNYPLTDLALDYDPILHCSKVSVIKNNERNIILINSNPNKASIPQYFAYNHNEKTLIARTAKTVRKSLHLTAVYMELHGFSQGS